MSLDLVEQKMELERSFQNQDKSGEMPDKSSGGESVDKPVSNDVVDEKKGEMPNNVNDDIKKEEEVLDQNNPEKPQPPTEVNDQFNWEEVGKRSNGVLKDEATMAEVIEKANKYSELSGKVQELESNQFKPANDFVSKLNSLILDGAKPEQIEAFVGLNKLGDLNSMTAREILVNKEILLNGATREVADFKIDRNYDYVGLDEDSVEYKALLHQQELDAREALQKLNEYKTGITTVVNVEKEAAEQARLQEVSNETQRMSFVSQEAPKIAQNFDGKISRELSEGKTFDHNYDDSFKSKISDLTVEFFEKTKLPLSDENLPKLAEFLEVKYISENINKIYDDMYNQISSDLNEKYANKYENRSGLANERSNPNPLDGNSVKSRFDAVQDIAKKAGFRNY